MCWSIRMKILLLVSAEAFERSGLVDGVRIPKFRSQYGVGREALDAKGHEQGGIVVVCDNEGARRSLCSMKMRVFK